MAALLGAIIGFDREAKKSRSAYVLTWSCLSALRVLVFFLWWIGFADTGADRLTRSVRCRASLQGSVFLAPVQSSAKNTMWSRAQQRAPASGWPV